MKYVARVTLLLLAVYACSLSLPAVDRYVSLTGLNIPPYTSWANAATNIQPAVDISQNGDIVWLASGTYFPGTQIMITNDIRLIGAGASPADVTVDSLWRHRGFFISNAVASIENITIFRGQSSGSRYPTDDLWPTNCGAGVFILYEGMVSNCILRDNIATGVYAEANYTNRFDVPSGGGAYCYYGGNIIDCKFYDNRAMHNGAGAFIFVDGEIWNSVFAGNQVTRWLGNGGGVYCRAGGRIWFCTITNNYAAYGGGGVYVEYAGSVLYCSISNNVSGWGGGGIFYVANDFGTPGGEIYGCTIAYNKTYYYGGGIYCHTWSPNLHAAEIGRCTVIGNSAQHGGGLYGTTEDPVENSLFAHNTAVYSGGGVKLYNGGLDNCTVCSNSVTDPLSTVGGGGLFLDGSHAENCRIFDNVSSNIGGGVFFSYDGYMSNSFIAGNCASNKGGGVYYMFGGQALACSVSGNVAYAAGGGLYFEQNGEADLSTILKNSAPLGAGFLQQAGGTIRNSLVHHNSAWLSGGGGACLTGGVIESSTIADNSAVVQGGGLYCLSNSIALNSIIYANSAATDNNISLGFTGLFMYCCSDPLPAGTGNINANPRFLQTASVYYNLSTNSPCIEAGTNQAWMTGATDLDGKPRILNSYTDIGAYEFPQTAYCRMFSAPLVNFTPEYSFPVGQVSNVTFSFANIGGSLLNGAVSNCSPPFYVISGSPYSLPLGQSHFVTVQYAPDEQGWFEQTVYLTGGTEPVPIEIMGSAYIPEPGLSLLFLLISFGIIRLPRMYV